MVENEWAFDLETSFFSVIKAKLNEKLKTKYPNIYFTTTDSPKDAENHYPTVYVHELPGLEKGRTTEQQEISGIEYGMQIEVTTNKSQKEARTVMKEVASIFKSMGFEINNFPEFSNKDSVYRNVMRVKRVLGNEDTF